MTREMESNIQNAEGKVQALGTVDWVLDSHSTERAARRYGIPDIKDLGKIKSVVSAANNVSFESLPDHYWPEGIPGKLIEYATRVETIVQNSDLSSKQVDFAGNLKDNLLGAALFFSEFPDKVKDLMPTKGHIVRKLATSAVVVNMALAGCRQLPNTNVTETSIPPTPIVETLAPTDKVPVGASTPTASSESSTPTEAAMRQPVTPDDVKNLQNDPEVKLDNSGELTGMPADSSTDKVEAVKNFYQAITEKFPGASVFYSQDPEGSGQWILYAISPEGKLYNRVVSYSGGPEQFADYPISYSYNASTDKWGVIGEYKEIDIPGGTLSAIWKGLPQFVAHRVPTSTGNTYFKEYAVYPTYADQNPFAQISNIEQILNEEGGEVLTFDTIEGVVHTENGYKITVGDSQRVIEISEANAEQQIVFDEEFNLYKIFDADGYITAEYDPGQGNEGEAGYVPATGWVDIQRLAKDFICKEGSGESCMNLTTNNSVYFESISAGIWRYVDAIDDAGHILGRALLVQMASRTNEQQPTIYWLLAEAVPKDSPEYSTFSYVPFMIAEKGINPLDYYHKVFPIEKFMESVPKGYVLTLVFGLNGRSYLYWFDHSIQTADNDVLSMLESRGQTGNLMNVIMNDSGHKGR